MLFERYKYIILLQLKLSVLTNYISIINYNKIILYIYIYIYI